jgi:hypothetical protein
MIHTNQQRVHILVIKFKTLNLFLGVNSLIALILVGSSVRTYFENRLYVYLSITIILVVILFFFFRHTMKIAFRKANPYIEPDT